MKSATETFVLEASSSDEGDEATSAGSPKGSAHSKSADATNAV